MDVVRWGLRVMAKACCVPPTYEVPMVPILPFDQLCCAIHSAVSNPSGPSSVSMCQVPSDS